MLKLVLRYRFKLWMRSLRSRTGRLRAGPWATAAFYLLIALGIGLYAGATAVSARDNDPGTETGLLYIPIAGIVFMTLLGGISISLNELFVSSDVELLLSTPLNNRQLYLLKLLDCSLPAWPTAGWWGSAVAGYAVALGLGWGFVLVGLLAVCCLAMALIATDVVIVLLLARVLPPRRLREGVVLLSSLLGVSVWIAWIAGGGRAARTSAAANLATLDSRLRWTPVGWAHGALAHAQAGDSGLALLGLVLLALLASLCAILAYMLFARFYLTGWSSAQESITGRHRRARAPRTRATRRSAAVSIALKDWRTLRRDVPYLSSLIPTLIYSLVYPFLLLRLGGSGSMPSRWIGLAGLPLVPLMAASTLGLTAIAREGKSFEVMRASPASAGQLLTGKILTVYLPIAALTLVAGLGLAAYHHAPAPAFVVAGVGALWLALGCSAIGVSAGAISPDFEAKPSRRNQGVRGPGCFLYAVLALVFGGASAAAVFVVVAAALHRLGSAPAAGIATLAAILVAVAVIPAGVLVYVGLRRLGQLLGPEA